MWGPRLIAKLVQISPISMVYAIYNELVTGAYKPTNITGVNKNQRYWREAINWNWAKRDGHRWAWWHGNGSKHVKTYYYQILVGWTSIYKLFWSLLGTRVLTHSHCQKGITCPFWIFLVKEFTFQFHHHCSCCCTVACVDAGWVNSDSEVSDEDMPLEARDSEWNTLMVRLLL